VSRGSAGVGSAARPSSADVDGGTDRASPAARTPPDHDASTALTEEARRLAATLKPAQRRVLADLAARGADELTRAEYERIGLVSRSQAALDLAELVQMGLLERIGAGRATQYRRAHPGGGRKRKWTEERIRTELEAFCAGRPEWPRAHDFKAAGRGDLYLAASRYGGVEHWATELGYEDEEETPALARPRRRSPPIGRLAFRAVRPAVASAAGLALALTVVLGLGSDAPDRGLVARTANAMLPVPTPQPARPAAGHPGASAAPVSRSDRGSILLTLSAVRGTSWVTVREGTARGRLVYAGTLTRGATARLRGARLWIELGSPWNLDARLGGRALDVRRTRTGIVTTGGLRVTKRAPRAPATPPPPTPVAPPPPAPVPSAPGPTTWPVSASPPPAPPAPPPSSAEASPDPPPSSDPVPEPPGGP